MINKKYSSEVEMCEDITPLISGILIPVKHRHIPEVPRFSHNNHSDMLFLCKSGEMFVVEYKLNGYKSLLAQVYRNDYTIGIINQNIKMIVGARIFQYTGQDRELEAIHNFLISRYGVFGSNYRKDYQNGNEAVYYWGYKNTGSSLRGGIKSGKRISYFELYKQAIRNLQKHYNWTLDFYLVYSVLGGYARSTAKKHYNNAMMSIK